VSLAGVAVAVRCRSAGSGLRSHPSRSRPFSAASRPA